MSENALVTHVVAPKAVCFDVFGTLLPPVEHDPYRSLIARSPDPGAARRAVLTQPWLWEKSCVRLGQAVLSGENEKAWFSSWSHSAMPYPGVFALLAACRRYGWRVAVCSNAAYPFVEPVQRLLGSCVDAWVWSCEVGCVKPETPIFREVERRLSVPAHACMMVGDSFHSDFLGARQAGWRAWRVQGSSGAPSLLHDSAFVRALMGGFPPE